MKTNNNGLNKRNINNSNKNSGGLNKRNLTVAKTVGRKISSELLIDYGYQRPLSSVRVRKICENFNPELVNLIKVSYRDGKFYIFDGQHTKAALEMLNGDMPVMVDVIVYEFVGLSPAEQRRKEAELFAMQNGIARHVESASKFRALFEAKDIDVMQFHEITNDAGLLMDFTGGSKDGKLVCFKEAWNAWHLLGNTLFVDMLKLVRQIWGGDKESLQAPIIGGLSLFIKAYHDTYDRKTLIDRLSRVSPLQIIRDGAMFPESSKSKYMRQMMKHYNKGTKRKLGAAA